MVAKILGSLIMIWCAVIAFLGVGMVIKCKDDPGVAFMCILIFGTAATLLFAMGLAVLS